MRKHGAQHSVSMIGGRRWAQVGSGAGQGGQVIGDVGSVGSAAWSLWSMCVGQSANIGASRKRNTKLPFLWRWLLSPSMCHRLCCECLQSVVFSVLLCFGGRWMFRGCRRQEIHTTTILISTTQHYEQVESRGECVCASVCVLAEWRCRHRSGSGYLCGQLVVCVWVETTARNVVTQSVRGCTEDDTHTQTCIHFPWGFLWWTHPAFFAHHRVTARTVSSPRFFPVHNDHLCWCSG